MSVLRICNIFRSLTSRMLCTDGPLNLEPSATVFHYAQTLFEGLKAYRDDDGKITLFRPDMNMKRMNRSAARIALPVSESASEFVIS
jgi:branched-subunit amino acid aminotransferase/4-amino-4-deoxychorismate lyase